MQCLTLTGMERRKMTATGDLRQYKQHTVKHFDPRVFVIYLTSTKHYTIRNESLRTPNRFKLRGKLRKKQKGAFVCKSSLLVGKHYESVSSFISWCPMLSAMNVEYGQYRQTAGCKLLHAAAACKLWSKDISDPAPSYMQHMQHMQRAT